MSRIRLFVVAITVALLTLGGITTEATAATKVASTDTSTKAADKAKYFDAQWVKRS